MTPPTPTPRPSPTTQATYRRDWELFIDWCQAYGHTPLPANPETVQAFLAEPSIAARRRRCAAAIAWAHRTAGQPAPIEPAQRSPDPALLAVDTGRLLERIPLWGWPSGMFGRRDALLLILRFEAGLTLPAIAALTTDRIRIDDRLLIVDRPDGAVTLPPTDDARHCPACVWLRWRPLLAMVRRNTAGQLLRARLAVADDTDNAVPRQVSATRHRCLTGPPPSSPVDGPVMLPIDRWGAAPLPRRPPTLRALSSLTTAHRSGLPPHHRADVATGNDPDAQASETEAPVMADTAEPSQLLYQRGVAARQQAVAALRSARTDIDDVNQQVDELQSRIDDLIVAAVDLQTQIHPDSKVPLDP